MSAPHTESTVRSAAVFSAGDPAAAERYFAGRLSFEIDPADVWEALSTAGDRPGFTVVDCRTPEQYAEGHLPGAVNVPWRAITSASATELPAGLLVTYCWGPGCNASTKGALRLAAAGREVKEMIGGIEYWRREGYPVEVEGHEPR